jgi:N utilization substance protein B
MSAGQIPTGNQVQRRFMAGRSEARRFVLQMLYLFDQNPDADMGRIRRQLNQEFPEAQLQQFAWDLLNGIQDKRRGLDELIRRTAVNWRIERMAPTDRNVLRMGLYEMRYVGTPPAVVIDEAVTIAREFGTENSGGFVNGILDKLIPAATETDFQGESSEVIEQSE